MIFKSKGKLIYSPKSHLGDPSKWLILTVDDEISKYYRHLFYKEFPWLGKLNRPVFGSHISVIRGEKINNQNEWGIYNNSIIEFQYKPGVIDNKEYFWLKVIECPILSEIRQLYGLSPIPKFGFHLTIGRK